MLKESYYKKWRFFPEQCYFYWEKASYSLDNCSFINNHAKFGGVVNSIGSNDIFVKNCTFDFNSASRCGGAIYSYGNVYLENCNFTSNNAEIDGGAVYSRKDVNIGRCIFRDNYARNCGGAVEADNIALKRVPSYFINNSAKEGHGGAIYTNRFSTDVILVSFINNHAGGESYSKDGGAVYINCADTVTFENCVFIGNSCTDEGGAIYLDTSNSHLTLDTNIFMDNSAGYEGQSVYNCSYYDEIENNFWGFNNPSSDNDFDE